MRQQFTVGDLFHGAASSVDSITVYNEFYSIRTAPLALNTVFDKARSKTRVNIGSPFQRWRELKECQDVTPDASGAACDRTPRLLCFFSIVE